MLINKLSKTGSIGAFSLLAAVLAGLSLTGCTSSAEEVTMSIKDFELTGFDRIKVEDAFEIEISQSDSFKVSLAADDFSHVRVEKEGDTLVIKRQGIEWFAPFHSKPRAIVTLPALKELNISGASHGKLDSFTSDESMAVILSGASSVEAHNVTAGKLEVKISGASHLNGEISAANDMKLEASGASKIDLAGTAGSAEMTVSGASKVELGKFPVQAANMDVSGASNAFINLNGRLDANVSGASTLCWSGSPIMGNIQTSGASNLRRK
jgi:hypothetical protein